MGELEQIAVSIIRMRDLFIADDLSIKEIDVAVGVGHDAASVCDDGADALAGDSGLHAARRELDNQQGAMPKQKASHLSTGLSRFPS